MREREFNRINGFSSEESRPYEEPVDKAYPLKFQFTKDKCKVNGKETYARIFIRKKPVSENKKTPTEDRKSGAVLQGAHTQNLRRSYR